MLSITASDHLERFRAPKFHQTLMGKYPVIKSVIDILSDMFLILSYLISILSNSLNFKRGTESWPGSCAVIPFELGGFKGYVGTEGGVRTLVLNLLHHLHPHEPG